MHLTLIVAGLLGYLVACLAGVLLRFNPRLWNYSVHLLSAASSLLILVSSSTTLALGVVEEARLTLPQPLTFFPPLVLALDPLSSFMLFVISLVSLYSSIFALGYVDEYYGRSGSMFVLGLCYPAFIASMMLVALAGDAILFIIAWELMSISSFFLILTDYEDSEVRRAAMVYMAYAAMSAVFLLAALALGYAYTGSYIFSEWRKATIAPQAAWAVFVLALLGFSAKAGVVPLHSWLPMAHPAAPSHVSALLSGVMVKLSMYGIVRIALDALGAWAAPWWGVLVLLLGALSTFYGVALALVQHDVKRLLAYHTIENIGIIMLGLGVALSAKAAGLGVLAVLGLVAGLFHLLNHALFKSLLFLCSGALVHQLHTREIGEMGGLYRRMRATALAFLVGALGITAMPMFNGFASEWCTYYSLALAVGSRMDMASRFSALASIASLAAAGVLAVYCFTKVFGLVFLGTPRSREAEEASSEPTAMKISYALPASLIVLLGIVPGLIVAPLARTSSSLLGASSPLSAPGLGILVQLWARPSAYIPLVIAGASALIGFLLWSLKMSRVKYVVTQPFVSGVAYEPSMAPTASLYVGTYKELMSRLYGVEKSYERGYAVKYWTLSRVRVVERPKGITLKLLERIGAIPYDLSRVPERFDDVLYAFFRASVAAVMKVAELPELYYKAFYAACRIIASAAERCGRTVLRIQSGKLHMYLAYIYALFFALLVYYMASG